jgi:hypothetical protein
MTFCRGSRPLKDQFISLQLKDKKTVELIVLLLDWLRNVVLTNNELKVKILWKRKGYTERLELFDVAANEFKYFKILTDIQRQ